MSSVEIAIYAIFCFAVLFPLLPGLLELRAGSDDDPLKIDTSYARDPRFLGKSMREKLGPILRETSGEDRVPFLNRKNEFARVVDALEGGDESVIDDVVLSRGSFSVGARSSFLDVYARGDVSVGPGSRLRTLACDRNAQFAAGTSVMRWIDVNGDCSIGPDSEIGQSLSATGRVLLAQNVIFNRVFGRPVVAGTEARAEIRALSMGPMHGKAHAADRLMVKALVVEPESTYDVDIIASGDVEVGEGAYVTGSIKSGGCVTVRRGASVLGNVIARKTVTIEPDGSIFGHVFGDGDVILEEGALVGERHAPKTLHASRTARLAAGACVFGWLIAERGGRS